MAQKKQGKLRKKLSFIDLLFLGVGSIIGSGWLFAAQQGAQIAGTLAWISWLIGAAIIITIGLVFAELSSAMPRAGGFVRYPDFTHGSVVGFLIGFISMLAYSSVIGTEVEAIRGYAQSAWGALGTDSGGPTAMGYAFQIALVILFFLLNYWSVNFFGKANTFITIFKFIVPGFIIVFMFMHMDFSNFSASGASPGDVKGVFAAVTGAGIVYSFNGFRQPIEFAGEAKNAQKDVPKAIIFSVLVGLLIYLLLQFAFIGAVPADKLASGGWASIKFDSPWVGLAEAIGLGWLANLVLLDSLISPSATGNIYFSATARSLFAWAKNGTFYTIFQKVNPKTGLPRSALWLTLIMSILWMFQFQVWSGLIQASTSAKALTFVVGPVSLMALRKTKPNMKRPFFLKAARIFAPLAFMASTLVVYWAGWTVISLLVPIIIGALVFYFSFVDKNENYNEKKIKSHFKSAYWLLYYFIFVLVISGLGSFVPDDWNPIFAPAGAIPIIPSPWDTIICAFGSLVFYYWGVSTPLSEPRIDESEE